MEQRRTAMKHLILVGLPGSGKTTVGRLVSEMLHLPFADSDEWVERRTGRTIPALFAAEGEAYFRREEREALLTLCAMPPKVIATGGGAVLDEENCKLLRQSGRVIFLDALPEDIARRIGAEGRPLLQTNTIEQLARQRRKSYLACAHVTVSAENAQAAAERIVEYWKENEV
ncbi:MAG: shikimate kinase [Clostridiales bacterium]|nr:shikimate kinase [Candidatus Cacconaster stercorequi]